MRVGLAGTILGSAVALPLVLVIGCSHGKPNPKDEEPPAASVQPDFDPNNFTVDRPEQFSLSTASERKVVPALNVTGVVQPDISRAVPVISLASGRVVEVKARLGDQVKKGQLLLRVRSNDVASAYQTYLKAVNDERLAHTQLDRQQLLYAKGAVAKSILDEAENSEKDAKVDLDTATEQLRLLGVDPNHPSGIVEVKAPISGVITDQQVTNAAGVQGLSGPNPFTISDLSYVWVICDVYENDVDAVHVGQYADIRLTAYPGKVFKARIDNILPILDPTIHTSKVRLEVPNPERLMHVGMFATATFYGRTPVTRPAVPSTAILHLHDRDWVYLSLSGGHFKRQEVTIGSTLPGDMQEIVSGIAAGDKVVAKALDLQNAVEQ